MRKLLLLPVALTLAFVILGEVSNAAYEIHGIIYNSAGKGIADMWVELLDDDYGIVTRVKTDALGRYSFKNIPTENDYIVRVLTDGIYIGQERRVETGRDTATAHESTDFYLRTHPQFEDGSKIPTSRKQSKSAQDGSAPSTPARHSSGNELFVQEVPPAARAAYEEGVRLLQTDAENGRLKLKEAIDLFPDYFAALERYGVESVKAGQWDTGAAAIRKAIAINPRSHVSFYGLGVAQFQLKQYPEAIDSLNQMFVMAPDTPNAPYAHYCLGIALVKSSKPAEAEPHLRAAKQGGSQIPSDIHLALAQIYSSTNRYSEAADEVEQLIKEDPARSDIENLRELADRLHSKAR